MNNPNNPDNTEQITPEQAFERLWDGHGVRINAHFPVRFLTDIIDFDVLEKQSKQQSEKDVCEYLRNYEIYL